MRLISVTSKDHHVELVIEDDALRVQKNVQISDCAKRVYKEIPIGVATYTVLRKLREAERDFAYMRHGDSWREHISSPPSKFWTEEMTQDEKQLLQQAYQLLLNQAKE